MSAQLRVGKKKKTQRTQLGIGASLVTPAPIPVAQRRGDGAIECPYCPAGEYFSEQGYSQHVKVHKANDDLLRKKNKPGRVKIRYDLMTQEQLANDQCNGNVQPSAGNVIDLVGGGIDGNGGSNDDMDEPNAETNNNNDSNAGEGDDDFDFKPDSAGDDTNKLRARAQQGN